MAEREHLHYTGLPVESIDKPVASDSELPQPLEISAEGLARCRLDRNGSKRALDPALDLGREMAHDLGHVRWQVDPPDLHYRGRRLGGTSGSPNTSSNDSPRRPAAA